MTENERVRMVAEYGVWSQKMYWEAGGAESAGAKHTTTQMEKPGVGGTLTEGLPPAFYQEQETTEGARQGAGKPHWGRA